MKMFPVIWVGASRFADEVVRLRDLGLHAFVIGVPLEMLQEHEDQAAINTGYSLRALEQRGGLTAMDVNAILMDCGRYEIPNPRDQPYNHKVLLNLIEVWQNA